MVGCILFKLVVLKIYLVMNCSCFVGIIFNINLVIFDGWKVYYLSVRN